MLNRLKKFLKSIISSPDDTIIFKIIDVFQSKISDIISIKYQSIGKSTVSTELVKNVYKELAYIGGFSKKDSSLILEAYELENQSPDFILASIIFDADNSIFLIKDRNSSYQFNFSTNFINENKEVLTLFSITDTNTMLNVVFDSMLAKEKEKITRLKKKLTIKKNNLHIVSL